MCTQDAKPNGTYVVKDGEEQAYLDPKSVADIPFVGEKMTQTLNKYGIKTIADLRKWDMDLLVKRFGKNGWYLWHKARGIGNDELPSPKAEKSMSKERTFSENIEDEKEIFAKLFKLTEQLSHELRLAKLQTSCVTIKIRYPDFETYTHQRHIFPSVDTLELYELAKSLLQKAWSDRLPLRQIGIKFSSLTPLEQQLMLFNEHQDQKKYLEVMDILKQKYGKSKVFFGGSM